MRFPNAILSLLAFSVGNILATKTSVCSTKAPSLGLQQRQQDALEDFAYLFLTKKDAQTAFDKYIPGTYIQHSPAVAKSGRQVALDFLIPSLKDPGFSTSNLTVFAGGGLGILHYRMNLGGGLGTAGGISFAVSDIFKFKATCIVEHWDVLQQITGTEINPIAFF